MPRAMSTKGRLYPAVAARTSRPAAECSTSSRRLARAMKSAKRNVMTMIQDERVMPVAAPPTKIRSRNPVATQKTSTRGTCLSRREYAPFRMA